MTGKSKCNPDPKTQTSSYAQGTPRKQNENRPTLSSNIDEIDQD